MQYPSPPRLRGAGPNRKPEAVVVTTLSRRVQGPTNQRYRGSFSLRAPPAARQGRTGSRYLPKGSVIVGPRCGPSCGPSTFRIIIALNDLTHLKRRRAQLQTERDALNTAQRVGSAGRALRRIREWEPWQSPHGGQLSAARIEFDPTPLVSVAIQQGKCVACPRVVDQSRNFTDEAGDPTGLPSAGFAAAEFRRSGGDGRRPVYHAIAWLRRE